MARLTPSLLLARLRREPRRTLHIVKPEMVGHAWGATVPVVCGWLVLAETAEILEADGPMVEGLPICQRCLKGLGKGG